MKKTEAMTLESLKTLSQSGILLRGTIKLSSPNSWVGDMFGCTAIGKTFFCFQLCCTSKGELRMFELSAILEGALYMRGLLNGLFDETHPQKWTHYYQEDVLERFLEIQQHEDALSWRPAPFTNYRFMKVWAVAAVQIRERINALHLPQENQAERQAQHKNFLARIDAVTKRQERGFRQALEALGGGSSS